MKRTMPFLWLLVATLFVSLLVVGGMNASAQDTGEPASGSDKVSVDATPTPQYSSLKELDGLRFCEVAGGQLNLTVENKIGKQEFLYYDNVSNCLQAILSNKADAYVTDDPVARLGISRVPGLAIVPELIDHDRYGVCLPKGSALTPKVEKALEQFREDGTLDGLQDKWMTHNSSTNQVPEVDWDTSAGVLRAEVDNAYEPMGYLEDNKIKGYEAELLMLLGRELKMDVRLTAAPSVTLFNDLATNKCDIMASCFSITEERLQQVDMVEEYRGGTVVVVRSKEGAGSESGDFFGSLAKSFERTFITEGRWKLVARGLGVTLLITVSSGALGIALAFGLCLLRRHNNRLVDKVISCFTGLMGGLPVVVVLMILYYVVFGAFDISGVAVSIVGFTLIFGASAHSIMQAGIDSVDPGQEEGAVALGYSRRATFHKVIFPQAARQFMPVLSGELVGLLKNTSVVGYIAVEDLTRVSDLIRARTMEAFFPLIASALIYFLLAMLIGKLASYRANSLRAETRPREIKGVITS